MNAEAARVCVGAVRSCKAVSGERSEPQEGGATPRLSPVQSTGHYRLLTTTTGTLEEHSSSSRRVSSTKVPKVPGWSV